MQKRKELIKQLWEDYEEANKNMPKSDDYCPDEATYHAIRKLEFVWGIDAEREGF